MKQIFILIFIMVSSVAFSQSGSNSLLMSSNAVDDLTVTIKFEKLKVNGRNLWGNQIPYNLVWKPGITTPPTITFDKKVIIEQQEVPAGTYSIYTIPNSRYWTILITDESEVFSEEDVIVTIQVPVKSIPGKVEQMQFSVNNYGNVTFAWDKVLWTFDVDSI